MLRTQIYLTEEENSAVTRLAAASGQGKSEVIRNAIDEYLTRHDTSSRLSRIQSAFGIWKSRKDLPDLRKMREEFDRF